MNRLPSTHRLRPPSSFIGQSPGRRVSNLTIRTTENSPSPATTPHALSPAQLNTPGYPIPIPTDKLEKALRLYGRWKTEEALAQREAPLSADNDDNNYLPIPTTPIAHSRTSVGSSRHNGTSISASMYDATDMTSVISFDGSYSATNELSSYTGKRVRTRVRRPFDSVGKVRTALVRLLGSCPRCRERRVPCNLEEHHDIATLERLRSEKHIVEQPDLKPERSPSSGSKSSQRTAKFVSGVSRGRRNISGQASTSLMGIGQNPELLHALEKREEIQSPGGLADPLAGITAPTSVNSLPYDTPLLLQPDPYSTYQNGQMLVIGLLQQERYYCQHLGGCEDFFEDVATLQTHFEDVHFPYSRLDNPVKYFCSFCWVLNDTLLGPCNSCHGNGLIKSWICGDFFRTPDFFHHPANGPASLSYASTPYHEVVHAPENSGPEWQLDIDDDEDINMDDLRDTTTDRNTYGGTGTVTFDFNQFDGLGNGGNGYQGTGYRDARRLAMKQSSLQFVYDQALYHCQRQNVIILICLLLTFILLLVAHDWVLTSARGASLIAESMLREQLPTLGFLTMFVSFSASCFLKHVSALSSPSTTTSRCPLHALTPSTSRYRPKVPASYMLCAGYS